MELVERQELLAELSGYLDEARGESGRLVLVGGEAGVGKTSLVRAFVDDLPGDVRVLWGACDPLSTPRPLAPFHDMEQVAQLLEGDPGRHELLTSLLAELGLSSVMVVEDAHWADEATLDVLRFVGRRVDGSRSLVLVTYRDDEVGAGHPLRAVLGDLATAPGCQRLNIPPLTSAGVAVLAAGHALEPVRLHRITGGNPFYVTEVLAAPGWTVPATVADAVLARTARLSPQARDLLDIVSLAPGGLEPEIAETLLLDAVRALDECIEQGVLVVFAALVMFRHELARLAIEEAVPAGTRRTLHRRLLEALEAMPGADPARLAHHAEAAGDAEAVLELAPAAAATAASLGAHREAAAQYARALRFAEGVTLERLIGLLESRAYECHLTEHHEEAIEAQKRALEYRRELGDLAREGDAVRWLSRLLWFAGRVSEADEAGKEAVALLERLQPGRELALAYCNMAQLCMNAEDSEGTVAWGARAIELSQRLDDMAIRAHALNSIGTVEFLAGDLEGKRKLEESLEIARRRGLEYDVGRAFVHLAWGALGQRSYPLADHYLQEGLEYCNERDLDLTRSYLLACRARSELDQGRWPEAGDSAASLLRDLRTSPLARVVALTVLGLLRARRGDADVWPPLDEARELAEPTGELQRIATVAAARAEAFLLEGKSVEVAAATKAALDLAVTRRSSWMIGELAYWRWRAGVREEISAEAAEPYALQIAGDWQSAATIWGELGCPYQQADALSDGGEAAMREALAIFTRLGAELAADRLRERMRSLGIARVPARPRASTRAAPAQLTRRQLEVLELLEEGASNAAIAGRLFITEKTAAHHVSAILRKLGVRSRGEAAAAARKMGIPPAET